MSDSRPLYEPDLAYIHDIGFSTPLEGFVPGLLAELRKADIRDGTIVDLGCGGGIWVEKLVDAGYQAIGVDASAAMITLARQRVPAAELRAESIWDCHFPRCRAVTALGEVVCYRADETESPDLNDLFTRVFDALEPGGLLIFDVAEIGLDRTRDQTFAEGDDWACLVKFRYDESQHRLERNITSFRRLDESFRRSRERHIVQLYDGDDVVQSLSQSGFRVRRVRKLGDAALMRKRLGFIARKPCG